MVRRVVSALVWHETDPLRSPFRRLAGAVFGGVMVAVIALASVGLYGLFRPGGKQTWRTADAVIVEKETGARYVFVDGVLHPMLNFASARLVLGRPAPTLQASANSLADVPRGLTLGIADAPDALPSADRLLGAPWVFCSRNTTTGQADSVLSVGRRPEGGRSLGDQSVLVTADTGTTFLIWHNHRYAIAQPDIVLASLGLGDAPRIQASGGWVDTLPAGLDIAPPVIENVGTPSSIAGYEIGAVVLENRLGGERQYYGIAADRLVPLTEFAAYIQQRTVGQANFLEVNTATVATYYTPGPAEELTAVAPPTTVPRVVDTRESKNGVCAEFTGPGDQPSVLVGTEPITDVNAVATPQRSTTGTQLTGSVVIRPGWATVVEAVESASTTEKAGTLYLVTDAGRRYALANRQVLMILGYELSEPVRLPAILVDRLPAGPQLSPEAALKPAEAA